MAIGWVLVGGTLCQNLYPIDASVALFGLVFAELSSCVLLAGLDRIQHSGTRYLRWEDAVGHLLLRWVLFSISMLILAQNYLIRLFEHHQYAFICVLGLCLTLALIKLVCAHRVTSLKRGTQLVQMRNTLLAAGIFGFSQVASLDSDIILSFAIGLYLAILVTVSAGAVFANPPRQHRHLNIAQLEHTLADAAPFLLRYADVLILSWVLSPLDTLNYLIARGLAQLVLYALNQLSDRIADTLDSAYNTGNQQNFVAVAARTNLGFLLIGGAASLAALSMGAYVPLLFNLDSAVFRSILLWLVTAEVAPVIFGATGLLLNIAQCRRETILLSFAGVVAVWSTAIIFELTDPRDLAQLFAQVQMSIAAISAVFLGLRFGIWPGLTALLFRQIKLL